MTVCTNLITGLFVAVCYDRAYEKKKHWFVKFVCHVKKTFAFFKSPCLSLFWSPCNVCLSIQLRQALTLLHGKKARNSRGETAGHQVILVLVKSTQKILFFYFSLFFPFLSTQTEIRYDCRVPLFVYCASSKGIECPTFFTIFRRTDVHGVGDWIRPAKWH